MIEPYFVSSNQIITSLIIYYLMKTTLSQKLI